MTTTECFHEHKTAFIGQCNKLAFSTDSGGGFFLACEKFGRTFDHSFPVCAFFLSFLSFFFFFEAEISSNELIPLLCKDQSTVAQRAETTAHGL